MNPLVLIGIGAALLMAMGGKKKPPEPEPEYEPEYEPEPESEPETMQALIAQKATLPTQPKQAFVAGGFKITPKSKAAAFQAPPPQLKVMIGGYATTKLKVGQKQQMVIAGVGDAIFVPSSWKHPYNNTAELIQETLPPNTPLPGRRFTIVAKNPGMVKFQFHPASGAKQGIQEIQTTSTIEVTVS